MITPKQWKEFNKHVDKMIEDVESSEDWKSLVEELQQLSDYLGKESISSSGVQNWLPFINLEWIGTRMGFMKVHIPKRTVEECLDWLANRSNKAKERKEGRL